MSIFGMGIAPGEWDWMEQMRTGRTPGIFSGGTPPFFPPPQQQPKPGLAGFLDKLGGAQNLGLAILANSGYSPQKRSLGEIIGTSALQAQQMGADKQNEELRRRYMEAQIEAMRSPKRGESPFGSIDPSKFTRESIQRFIQTGNYGDLEPVRSGGYGLGNINPGDYTPESLAKYEKTGNVADLRRYVSPAQPSTVTINGVPTTVQPDRTGATAPRQYPLTDVRSHAGGLADVASTVKTAEEQAKIDVENAANAPKRAEKTRQTIAKIDNVMGTVQNAIASTGPTTAGMGGAVTRGIPGSPAFDMAETLKTVKANLGFAELQQMREASPTGGALGQVAVAELEALQASVASLEQRQSPEKLRENLARINEHYARWKQAVQQSAASFPNAPPAQAEPPGRRFTTPGGATVEIVP